MAEVVAWDDIGIQIENLKEEVEDSDLSKKQMLVVLEERLEPHVFEAVDPEAARPPVNEGYL